jgi:hypothetical protein
MSCLAVYASPFSAHQYLNGIFIGRWFRFLFFRGPQHKGTRNQGAGKLEGGHNLTASGSSSLWQRFSFRALKEAGFYSGRKLAGLRKFLMLMRL